MVAVTALSAFIGHFARFIRSGSSSVPWPILFILVALLTVGEVVL